VAWHCAPGRGELTVQAASPGPAAMAPELWRVTRPQQHEHAGDQQPQQRPSGIRLDRHQVALGRTTPTSPEEPAPTNPCMGSTRPTQRDAIRPGRLDGVEDSWPVPGGRPCRVPYRSSPARSAVVNLTSGGRRWSQGAKGRREEIPSRHPLAELKLAGAGWPWRPTALLALTVTTAIGVALLPAAATRQHRR
jgi:hypothetical protein